MSLNCNEESKYKTKITLEHGTDRYTYESSCDDIGSVTLKSAFSKLLVMDGFSPSVLEFEDGDPGKYKYVGEDEVIIKRSFLEELEKIKKEAEKKAN